jgi:formate dehydrogenase subunit gamma
MQMTMGDKELKKLGFEPIIPDQGFYNVGQKLFAIPALLGGFIITITGVIMMLSKQNLIDVIVVQWSILIHFVIAGLVFSGLLIHIYMAAIAKGERPALMSMFTGSVPEAYAKHHHKSWYDDVAGKK